MSDEILLPFSTPRFSMVAHRDICSMEQFPDHAQRLGIITAEWNVLEQYWVLLLAKALDTNADIVYPMAYAVIANKGRLQALHKALERLIKAPTKRKELKTLLNRLLKTLDKRNRYVHAIYVHVKGKDIKRVDIREVIPPKRPNLQNLSLGTMLDFITQMAVLKQNLHDFILSEPWKARPRASRAPASPKGPRPARSHTPTAPHTPPLPSP